MYFNQNNSLKTRLVANIKNKVNLSELKERDFYMDSPIHTVHQTISRAIKVAASQCQWILSVISRKVEFNQNGILFFPLLH